MLQTKSSNRDVLVCAVNEISRPFFYLGTYSIHYGINNAQKSVPKLGRLLSASQQVDPQLS